jgi:hypothetical protein
VPLDCMTLKTSHFINYTLAPVTEYSIEKGLGYIICLKIHLLKFLSCKMQLFFVYLLVLFYDCGQYLGLIEFIIIV